MAKIYTKTGDKGQTSLIGGTRVRKNNLRVECYGTIDELNAQIGLLNDYLVTISLVSILTEIQDRLFTIGAALACDPEKEPRFAIPDLREVDIILLEKEIDKMNDSLPKMTHFLLPGGHVIVSHSHIARTICRRTERLCVGLFSEQEEANILLVIKYLNRLSDYLFVLGRFIAMQLNVEEVKWKPRK
ncbi:MAG TPA: cob(I)yrinic acid a,c-diamide adenosyltransferase [Arachidicoccus soli]|nr:cob(I)yrinic acid a,c-diamide adenosyltransferase [Arachidicoccus soli]